MFNTSEINQLINQSYALFSTYSFGNIVAVHHGNCCLSHEDAVLLKTTPVKEINRRLIYEYLDASEDHDQHALALQIKYLLPRILDLLVKDEHIHHSAECILDKCRFNLSAVWKDQEIEFMNRFALCFFRLKILVFDDTDQVDSYLIMFHKGGLNIQPLLDEWLKHLHISNALLNLLYILYYHFDQGVYRQSFADEKLIQLMQNWANKLRNNEIFVTAIIDVLTSNTIYCQYQYIIESVFEEL